MIPNLSTILNPIRRYKYSITIGMLCLFFAPMVLPETWVAYANVGPVWQYVSASFFFIAVSMIITRDVWPWISRKLGWSSGRIDKTKYGRLVVKKCKQKGGDPPYQISLDEFDGRNILTDFLRASTDIEIRNGDIVVSAENLQNLKDYL